jgi:hypothetical protein
MSQRLFDVPKVGLFLDKYVPSLEKRKSGEVKILTLTLRVQPFDAKLATAIDDGVKEGSNVRTTLFRLNHPDPKPHLQRVNFALGCPRQNMTIFASPDTVEARILFEQVRIAGTYARTEKNVSGYAFCFNASLGPVGRAEQEYIHEWMLSQRFVTFAESEPSLEFAGGDDDEGTDADQKAHEVIDGRKPPTPMWDDDAPRKPPTPAAANPSARIGHCTATPKKRRRGNDALRVGGVAHVHLARG